MRDSLALTLAWALTALTVASAPAVVRAQGHAYEPNVVPASPEAADALKSFQVQPGLKVELFAAEPLLANPVAFGFDEKGRVFVVETFRLHHGVTDTRGHMNWLDADLACRTVADRVAMYKKYLGKGADDYAKEHDRLKLVEDRDGDGRADHATVFADGFNNMEDGLAAGVLARKGDVYFTCIPDLWLFKDTDNDGKADKRTSLHNGYGVHVGFLGHDLHGLTFGPDGKLYFSIGDRGLNVSTIDGKSLALHDAGAVLRCEPDGSNLELFATGLRNPQELAFDDAGNLFTVDNNSDSGDQARLLYLIEGGDSGWTMGWQYIERPVSRGPWNAERMWVPSAEGQPAHIVPPLANISDGPSGLVYNPGVTLLPDRYKGHFFLADFRGSAGQSGVRSFAVKPSGAAFKIAGEAEKFLWGLEATDVDFGPDGALYVSDWVEGWNGTGKGRIYKVLDPKADPRAANEVKALLAAGFDARPVDELVTLLNHPDRRIRQEAQFSLAARGEAAINPLRSVAKGPEWASDHPDEAKHTTLARRHAIWALGQIGRRLPATAGTSLDPLTDLCEDPDEEVRAQAARTLGDARYALADHALTARLTDPSPRVRSLAAIALGRLGRVESVGPLLAMLKANADADPYLRHAGVVGLVGSNAHDQLLAAATDPSPAVRLGALLALRRLKHPGVAAFLNDPEPKLVTEAARAVYDTPLDSALPALADLASRPKLTEPAWRRVVSAAARLGRPADAEALARLATRTDLPESVRVEAIEALAGWPKPSGRDRVTGLWRPIPERPATAAAAVVAPVYASLLKGPAPVRSAALKAAGPLPVEGAAAQLRALFDDPKQFSGTRVEALKALERLHDPALADVASRALTDKADALRVEGRRLLAKLRPADAVPAMSAVLDTGTTAERQGALATLATMPPGPADDVIAAWLDRFTEGKVSPEIQLDVLEAAKDRTKDAVAAKLRAIEEGRPKGDPLAPFRETLMGGDPARGETIVKESAAVQCLRCHKLKGRGGEVGPELSGVAGRGDRRYILESIATPNAQIAKGFETLIVATTDGQVHTGVLKEETPESLRLITAEGQVKILPKSDVEERKRGASAMPDDLIKQLSRTDLRDIISFLATLK